MSERFQEMYYSLDEDEMQAYITSAKNGNQRALEDLFKILNNMLSKYVNLLYHTRFKMADFDMRRFIALYVPEPYVRRYLLSNKLTPDGLRTVNKSLNGINYMIKRYGDEEDVRQTVNLTFVHCVMNYNRKESKQGGYVPFSGYLYNYFFYALKKNVDLYLIDQLGRKTFPLLTSADNDGDEEEIAPGFMAPPEVSAEELLGAEEIDEFWVVGDTAWYPFDELTVQERQLLKWRWVDGLKSSEISARITEHPNTIREHYGRIHDRLKEILDEDEYNEQNQR